MKQTIGLDRELKLRWLDVAAGLAEIEPNRISLRAKLMEALQGDIPAHFVRVKTCTVLIRTWLTVLPAHIELRNYAFGLLKQVAPDQRVAIHWGMLLLAYSFFGDVASAIGRAAATQDTVSRSQVSRKVTETWGQRTTVKRSILRVFQTFTDWNILTQNGTDETFAVSGIHKVGDLSLALWLAQVILSARGSTLTLSGLTQAPEIFPFQLGLTLSDMTRSGRFETFREGSALLVGVGLTKAAN